MTKHEMLNAGLALIEASTVDKKKTKEQLAEAFLALMAEYKGHKEKPASTKRALIIERDGKTYKYCNRHEQYEPIETFGIQSNKDGVVTYNPECSAATATWKAYNLEIARAEKLTMSLIDDVDELRAHIAHINDLKVLRAGKYDKTGIEGIEIS
jgi:outer membrane lipoprotein-sorting protein